MVDLALLQSVSYIAGALGVCVAAVYYVVNMKATLETRQAHLFRDFLKTQESYDFWQTFDEVRFAKFKDLDEFTKYPDNFGSKFNRVFQYWERLAVMVRRGLISSELIYEINYGSIIGLWEKYASIVVGLRGLWGTPQLYEPIEWLHGELKRIQKQKGHYPSVSLDVFKDKFGERRLSK